MRTLLATGIAAIVLAAPLSTSAATAGTARSWKGSWQASCWAKMNLTQKGTKVTGTFTWYAGQLTGTAKGSKLTGTWSLPWEHKGGTFVWTLSANGKKFQGRWAYKGKAAKSCSGSRMRTS